MAFRNQVQTRLAGVYGYMAGDLSLQGDLASAIALQGKTHAILAAQVAADPQNGQLREFLLQSEYWTAKYSEQKGDYRQAISIYREAFAGYQKLSTADPRDALAVRYLGALRNGHGELAFRSRKCGRGHPAWTPGRRNLCRLGLCRPRKRLHQRSRSCPLPVGARQ